MATIHLIEGPVGAGKSTFATKLSFEHKAPHIDLDQWMVNLFSPDRPETDFMPWYAERKDRCIGQIWQVASNLLELNFDVVLEMGLVQRAARADFYSRVDSTEFSLAVYLLDAPESVRKQRVQSRNQSQDGTFKMAVSDEIFALANSAWEPPDDTETRERQIQFI